MSFLSQAGYKVIEKHYKEGGKRLTPGKIYAYDAGLGVYRCSGLILHPELEDQIKLGAVLTDALLEPDRRLDGFYQGLGYIIQKGDAWQWQPVGR